MFLKEQGMAGGVPAVSTGYLIINEKYILFHMFIINKNKNFINHIYWYLNC